MSTVKDDDGNEHVKMHPSPQVLIDNTTFEDAANFLHTTFHGSLILRNNRFRKTLDLTGATFDAQNSHLCLSYNRITRLVMGSSHLGNPPNVSPSTQFSSVSSRPLHRSKIRTIQLKEQPGKKPAEAQCMSIGANPSTPEHARKGEEPLQTIYQTLGQAFLDAHDRAGFNEAWYLQTLAERKHTSPLLAWSSWVFLDLPSRYTVDVWRTVWISLAIMAGFAVLYFLEWVVFGSIRRFWCWIRRKEYHPREVHVLGHAEKQRAFRFRLFEPMHTTREPSTRRYTPWRDGVLLSMRSFLKLGLGTRYPQNFTLRILTAIEWILGVYLLIHFILAVKNNLPFILPFLGAVH